MDLFYYGKNEKESGADFRLPSLCTVMTTKDSM